jgi:hypothetical protein
MEVDSISPLDDLKAVRDVKSSWHFVLSLSQARYAPLLAPGTFQVLVPLIRHSDLIGNPRQWFALSTVVG